MTKDTKFDGFLPCMYAAGEPTRKIWYASEPQGFVYRKCTNPAKEKLKVSCTRCADNISLVQGGHWPFPDKIDRPSCLYFRARVRNTL